MSGANEQRGLFSRLPDDPAYWQDLTNRIVEGGVPRLRAFSEGRTAWWSEIARFSRVLAAGAAAAVLASVLVLSGDSDVESPGRPMETYGLIPANPLAVTLASREAPPSMETLIALRNVESDR